ncbi:hypothetical protein B0H21DRAFT_52441 [Amylocystis lapponica]|nr:hypothetical protein B0H21DRAFT_52441 [Amylocystis lapponica]
MNPNAVVRLTIAPQDAPNDMPTVYICLEPIIRALNDSRIAGQAGTPTEVHSVPRDSRAAVDSQETTRSNKRKEQSVKQQKCRGKRPLKLQQWRHEVLGYMIPRDVAVRHGAAMWGTEGTEDTLAYGYVAWAIWQSGLQFSARMCLVYVRKTEVAFCISLAENTSIEDMELPPQGNVHKLKRLLDTRKPPTWWKLCG